MQLSSLFVCVTLLSVSHAWWIFGRNREAIHPQTGVLDECVEKAENGSCEFYTCMERRFPCERHSFAINHGQLYCHRYQQHLHRFTPRGQEWVRSSQRCLTRALLDKYRLPVNSCDYLSRVGWDNMSNCYLWEGFCSNAWENREALWKVLRVRDLVHSVRVWREILQLARGCSGYNFHRFIEWGMQKISPFHG